MPVYGTSFKVGGKTSGQLTWVGSIDETSVVSHCGFLNAKQIYLKYTVLP